MERSQNRALKIYFVTSVILILSLFGSKQACAQTARTYEEALQKGNHELKTNKLLDAKAYFLMALQMKPGDKVAQGLIQETVNLIQKLDNRQTGYYDLIDQGDDALAKGALELAKISYQKALQIVPGDTYALGKIKEIEQKETGERQKQSLLHSKMDQGTQLLGIQEFDSAVSQFQEAQKIFGSSFAGQAMFLLVQAATALILYTGGNTSFSGFPFLASFVAEDSFLPRWLTKRGHRLVFSNGIIVLTIVSLSLLFIFGATVNALIPLYAIGVFTGFAMAGFGMARYHRRTREPAWRRRLAINLTGGIYTAIVVAIFAVVKFTEGAWVIVILFPILVFAFIRLNREYRMEAEVLERIGGRPRPEPTLYPRRTVYLLVDSFDLATLAALRYARSLRPTTLRAVHFVIDTAQADLLREEWTRADRGVVLDFIDCPDRRLTRAAAELVSREAALPGTHVTVVLPRRSYSPLLGRLLHDRTADKIAAVVSQIPHSAATIVPFDVRSRIEVMHERHVTLEARTAAPAGAAGGTPTGEAAAAAAPGAPEEAHGIAAAEGAENLPPVIAAPPPSPLRNLLRGRRGRRAAPGRPAPAGERVDYDRPAPLPGMNPIGSLDKPGRATVAGRVRAVEIRPVERNAVLAVEISDSTGDLTALFYGRSHIPGIVCGSRVRFRGPVGMREGSPVMINPAYELLAPGNTPPPGGEDSG